jgi:hypothetical protein
MQAKNLNSGVAEKQKDNYKINLHPALWFNPIIENTVQESAD